MKKITKAKVSILVFAMFMILFALAIQTEASPKPKSLTKTIKKGHLACTTADNLNSVIIAVQRYDKQAIIKYIKDGRCFILKEGIQVTIVKRNRFLHTVELDFKGHKFHTLWIALD